MHGPVLMENSKFGFSFDGKFQCVGPVLIEKSEFWYSFNGKTKFGPSFNGKIQVLVQF